MEKIFSILIFIVIFKYLLSIILIFNNLKKLSFVTEIAFSILMILITSDNLKTWVLIILAEYLASKVLLLINVMIVKQIAFRKTIRAIRRCNEENTNKFKKIYQTKYGIRMKHGLPHMVGKKHRKTGIRFDRNGFPKFESIYSIRLHFWEYKEPREVHVYMANKIVYQKALKSRRIRRLFSKSDMNRLKNGDTPEMYVWHHHQSRGKMQLVSRSIHSAVKHIGGYSIWGAENN